MVLLASCTCCLRHPTAARLRLFRGHVCVSVAGDAAVGATRLQAVRFNELQDFTGFLTAAGNKLGSDVRRLFTSDGACVDDSPPL
jgi:hypothetical protein